jgi:hypothetical protein
MNSPEAIKAEHLILMRRREAKEQEGNKEELAAIASDKNSMAEKKELPPTPPPTPPPVSRKAIKRWENKVRQRARLGFASPPPSPALGRRQKDMEIYAASLKHKQLLFFPQAPQQAQTSDQQRAPTTLPAPGGEDATAALAAYLQALGDRMAREASILRLHRQLAALVGVIDKKQTELNALIVRHYELHQLFERLQAQRPPAK